MIDHIEDRMELKALVDFYATESDKNNQDCYVDIFRPDIKLNVYFGGKLGMQARDVQDMIRQYKAFGAAKVSFHMNGQQNVDFSEIGVIICHDGEDIPDYDFPDAQDQCELLSFHGFDELDTIG